MENNPTQPTQEKEYPELIGAITACRLLASHWEITTIDKAIRFVSIKSDGQEFNLYIKPLDCEEENPTQDTESWEKDAAEFALSLYKERFKGYAHFSEVIYQKFKQKKQEWREEWDLESSNEWTQQHLEEVKHGRTQGAEAAVELIRKCFLNRLGTQSSMA